MDSIIRQRNPIGTPTLPTNTSSSTTTATSSSSSSASSSSFSFSSSSVDFELVSIKPTTCYTSLRDILSSPASIVHSPRPPCFADHEISIRNRLVKQAAWAYLQPMSISPEADGPTVFHRVWTQFSGVLLRLITTAIDCLLGL